MSLLNYILPLLLIVAIVILSVTSRKLTLSAAITGGVIAWLIFTAAGYTGIAMLGTFFILGTVATSWKKQEKLKFKAADDRSSQRAMGQVLANGGVAGILGLLILFLPMKAELLTLMIAASLASATADTLSSELGMIYGRRFFNVISLKKEEKGLDGVISLEGTMIGLVGSSLIAVVYCSGFGWSKAHFFILLLAGTIGNLADSVLGALLERKRYLTNNQVNFLNTFIAALTALLFIIIF